MKIVYSRQALINIESIAEFVHSLNPVAASKIRTAIRSAIERLAVHPLSGRLQDDGSRKIVTKKYGYLIYYDAQDAVVEILTIQHGAKRRLRNDL